MGFGAQPIYGFIRLIFGEKKNIQQQLPDIRWKPPEMECNQLPYSYVSSFETVLNTLKSAKHS